MRYALIVLLALSLFPAAAIAQGKRIEVTATDDKGNAVRGSIGLLDDKAFEFESDLTSKLTTVYDLKNRTWADRETDTTVPLSKATAWAIATRQKAEEALKSQPDKEQAAFIALMLRPNLSMRVEEGKIVFRNDIVTYTIDGWIKPDPRWLNAFYAYDELNAYRKAIMSRKLPPFPQLEVSKKLKEHGIFPTSMKLEIKYPQHPVSLQVKAEIHDLTAAENSKLQEAGRD